MRNKRALLLLLACSVMMFACEYIVVPEEEAGGLSWGEDRGWKAEVLQVGQTGAGGLQIELAIENRSGEWSKMWATGTAVLMSGGSRVECDATAVSSGGHRLAPGFRMRGYIGGKKMEQTERLVAVVCEGAQASPGAKLTIPYSYVKGQYNYYEQDKNKVDTSMEVNLDQVTPDLKYPVAEELAGLTQDPGMEILALNDVVLVLKGIERTETGLKFTWGTTNPGEYPTYVHIGNPPVIGADGILYGFYETPDIVTAPITRGGGTAEWFTEVAIPNNLHGMYILLSVESGKQRLFANYALDITQE